MKIEYAVPCRGVEQLADTTYVLIGVEANAFFLPALPAVLRTFVVLCVSETHVATHAGQASNLTLSVLNPAMEPCGPPLTVPVQAGVSPNLPDGWASRTMLPIAFQFEAATEGCYSIEIAVGDSSHSISLLVRLPPSA